MKVRELKKLLAQFDDDLDVLGSDNDGYFYDYDTARLAFVNEGVEVDENDDDENLEVVVLV